MKKQGERGKGVRSRWRGRSLAGAWVAAAVGVVLMFVGSAAAASTAATATPVTYKAPYSGTEFDDLWDYLGGSGGPICGVAGTFPVLPFFNLTTGYANESVKATAKSCGTGTNFAEPEALAGFESNSITGVSGLRHVKASWVWDFSVKLVAAPSTGSSAEAYFVVGGSIYLYDETNGSIWFSNFPTVDNFISSGTYSHVYKDHESMYVNATLNKTHSYDFVVEVWIGLEAEVSPGTSTASAAVNMGSGGRSAFLVSVTGL